MVNKIARWAKAVSSAETAVTAEFSPPYSSTWTNHA
jgi:hypothetical protein